MNGTVPVQELPCLALGIPLNIDFFVFQVAQALTARVYKLAFDRSCAKPLAIERMPQ
jgi:hypothetical protein